MGLEEVTTVLSESASSATMGSILMATEGALQFLVTFKAVQFQIRA
jgi:hypothetical protein